MSNAPRDRRARRQWGTDDSETPILHVDMDSFFAEVEMCENPSLRGRPLIVGGVGNRGVVTSATYEARQMGVKAGMPLARARALCPAAQVVPSGRSVYSAYSRRVMEILRTITPNIEQVSIDEAFLDVSGARRRLGRPTQIAAQLRHEIRAQVGLPASVGIAVNKSVAKIASANAKPDGMLLVAKEHTVDFLHGLPVGALWGVGGKTEQVLAREGIDTIGQLAQCPLGRLNRLLGAAHAHHLMELAWGRDARPVGNTRTEKSIGTERTFASDIRSRAEIEEFILWAAHDTARRLRKRDMVATVVAIKIRSSDFTTITRSVSLGEATDLARDLARAGRRLFDAEPMPHGGVRLMGLRAEGLRQRSDGVAVPLEHDPRSGAAERVIDQVEARFGSQAITPASLLGRVRESEKFTACGYDH